MDTKEGEGTEFIIQIPIVWTMIYKIYGINRKIPELNHTNHLIQWNHGSDKKAHSGDLTAATKEGEYAEFIIMLPEKPFIIT